VRPYRGIVCSIMSAASSLPSSVDRRLSGASPDDTPLLDTLADSVQMMSKGAVSSERSRDIVETFVKWALAGELTVRGMEETLSRRIYDIDHLVSRQLDEIIHAEKFQRLEAAWRGLYYLTRRTAKLDGVKIRVLNVTKRELLRDFQESEFRQAMLPSQTVDRTLGTLGAEPFSIFIGDYSFDAEPEDVELLRALSKMGKAAHAPFLAAAAPAMFGAESYSQIPRGAAQRNLFASDRYILWRHLRCREESAYSALVVPPVLMRRLYPPQGSSRSEGFEHQEYSDGDAGLLWGSPAWALAAQLASSFGKGSWCAELHAREDGGVIRKLPSFEWREDEGDIGRRGPTQVPISDELYRELRDLGFVALCRDEKDGRVDFFETPTIRKPPDPEGDDEDEEDDAPPSDRLEYVIAAGRVAQYVTCIVREKRSSFRSVAECEQYLNAWAARYTVPAGAHTPEPAAQMPFLKVHFRGLANGDRRDGNFRVEGEVLPNLHAGSVSTPLPISVDVVLPQALPTNGGGQPRALALAPPADSGQTDTAANTSFAAACDSLERLTDLSRRQLIEEPEFQQLRNALLSAMKEAFVSPRKIDTRASSSSLQPDPFDMAVPFAQLHSQIVDRIAAPYRPGNDEKHRAYRAMAEMAEKRALHPGDAELLSDLIDLVFRPQQEDSAGNAAAFAPDGVDRLAAVCSASAAIGSRDGASPAAKAIAVTAQQSATRAHEHYKRGQPSEKRKANPLERYWRKLVWPDVEGAFSGGAAAATIFPSLMSSQFPLALPMVAAIGVVIGAGVRSGVAYGEESQASTRTKQA